MNTFLTIAGLFVVLTSITLEAKTSLNESALIEMALEQGPRSKGLKAQVEMSKAENALTNAKFSPRAMAQYTYASSNEDAIIQFLPVYESDKNFQLGVEQNLPLGAKVSGGLFAVQLNSTDGLINNATQVGAQVNLEVDVWSNFLGQLDKSELRSKAISQEISELQMDIGKQQIITDVRKIYWNLVINELSLDLSNRLIKTSKKQLRETLRQAREGASDKGDVARSKAQVQSRESASLFFSYQKEILIAGLQKFIPQLNPNDITISKEQTPIVEKKALVCIENIANQKELQKTYSNQFKIIDLLEEKSPLEIKIAEATNQVDVKLTGRYQTSGVENSHSRALSNISDRYRDGYQVGLTVSMPLGGSIDKAQKSRVLATKNSLASQKESLNLQLRSEHQKAQRSLSILNKAVQSQASSIKNLATSYKMSERKYKQARISLNTYVLEQDNLFNSELQLLDTKKQVINLLLDYFQLFPNHPCEINILRGAQL